MSLGLIMLLSKIFECGKTMSLGLIMLSNIYMMFHSPCITLYNNQTLKTNCNKTWSLHNSMYTENDHFKIYYCIFIQYRMAPFSILPLFVKDEDILFVTIENVVSFVYYMHILNLTSACPL